MKSNSVGDSRSVGTRRQWVAVAVSGVVAIAIALATFGREASGLTLLPESKLSITGTSTIHAWHSKATSFKVNFAAAPEWPAGAADLAAVEKAIAAGSLDSVTIAVDVKSMRSGKDGLDKNMVKALKADQHPKILCTITSFEAKPSPSGALAMAAHGRLTVAGVERKIEIPVQATREGEALHVKGSVVVGMKDFGIKPPVMMMGTLKTGNDVTVEFDLVVGSTSGSGS